MVKVPQPGQRGLPSGVPPTVTVEAPMAFSESFTVQIQISNKPQALPDHPCRQATLHALAGNSATVYIGNSGVNANGFPLNPGAAQDVHVDDLSKEYVFGTAGDKVSVEVEWGIGEVT